jgi:hypothetical protein
MASIYRVNYCPPNPGWNSRKLKKNRWFNDLDDLKAFIEENPSTDLNDLWVSHNGKRYVKFNINEAK